MAVGRVSRNRCIGHLNTTRMFAKGCSIFGGIHTGSQLLNHGERTEAREKKTQRRGELRIV
jgi:hypothetical protein